MQDEVNSRIAARSKAMTESLALARSVYIRQLPPRLRGFCFDDHVGADDAEADPERSASTNTQRTPSTVHQLLQLYRGPQVGAGWHATAFTDEWEACARAHNAQEGVRKGKALPVAADGILSRLGISTQRHALGGQARGCVLSGQCAVNASWERGGDQVAFASRRGYRDLPLWDLRHDANALLMVLGASRCLCVLEYLN